jgi:predicted nicotinamide N-methyase
MTINNSNFQADPLWLKLKAQIELQVQLMTTSVRLGNREFTWYRVANPDQLLQAAIESELPSEQVDPFWAATWRAARGLDEYLGRINCQEMRVLELGCGSGQAGTGAAARGARVVMTDAVPLALQVAQLNGWPVADRIEYQTLRWTVDRVGAERFPLIIGSDLVYDPNLFPLLDSCVRQHLATDGTLLLSEPHRHTGDKFSLWSVAAGWRVTEHDIDLKDDNTPIRIFECRL